MSFKVPQIKIDEEIQESRPVQEAPTPEAPVTSDPEPQSNADTPAQPEIRKVEIQVNDSVAEKNEKNEEKSKEDSDKVQDPVIKKDKIELKYKYREGKNIIHCFSSLIVFQILFIFTRIVKCKIICIFSVV